MINCKKCGMLKIELKSKCFCTAKKFDEKKLSKKTKEKKSPNPIAKVGKKRKERIKSNGSETQMNVKIYRNLQKVGKNQCAICQITVDEEDVQPSCFAHILPKGKYPEYRLFSNNIGFVCGIEDHNKFDTAINNLKKDIGLVELEKIIKNGESPDISGHIE